MEFYFDGETQPRVKITYRELFDGNKPPFVAPVVGFGSGGFYCYLPMPYKVSCKVIIRAPRVQFYQINYATYPDGYPLETFDPRMRGSAGEALERAKRLLELAGSGLDRK